MDFRFSIARPAGVLATVGLSIALLSTSAPAQTDSSVVAGTRVRVIVSRDDGRGVVYTGMLLGATAHSLVLRSDRSRDTVEISRASIARLQVSRGRHMGESAAKGLAIGAGVGAILGLALGESCTEQDFICFSRSETVPLAAVVVGALGTLVGTVAGARERWADVGTGFSLRVAPAAGRRVALAASITL